MKHGYKPLPEKENNIIVKQKSRKQYAVEAYNAALKWSQPEFQYGFDPDIILTKNITDFNDQLEKWKQKKTINSHLFIFHPSDKVWYTYWLRKPDNIENVTIPRNSEYGKILYVLSTPAKEKIKKLLLQPQQFDFAPSYTARTNEDLTEEKSDGNDINPSLKEKSNAAEIRHSFLFSCCGFQRRIPVEISHISIIKHDSQAVESWEKKAKKDQTLMLFEQRDAAWFCHRVDKHRKIVEEKISEQQGKILAKYSHDVHDDILEQLGLDQKITIIRFRSQDKERDQIVKAWEEETSVRKDLILFEEVELSVLKEIDQTGEIKNNEETEEEFDLIVNKKFGKASPPLKEQVYILDVHLDFMRFLF